jgi:hypothetical protein
MAKNLKPTKSGKKNGTFKGDDKDEGFPKMKAPAKSKEKITKNKWKDYEIDEEEDDDE